MTNRQQQLGVLVAGLFLVACAKEHTAAEEQTAAGGASSSSQQPSSNGSGGSPDFSSGAGKLSSTPSCNDIEPNTDNDGDGFSDVMGDCNDCTAQMNPAAIDYAGNGVDEDCNGAPDDDPVGCDTGLNLTSRDPMHAVRALDLCKLQQGQSYGVVAAKWVKSDGSAHNGSDAFHLGHGIVDAFGEAIQPQEGNRILVLSTGTARRPNDEGWQSPLGFDKGYISGAPPGYPKESPSCPNLKTGTPHDSIALEVRLRTPSNARSLNFNVYMLTYEYPDYVCSKFNDFVATFVTPTPFGQMDGNVCFDAEGNPLSVNSGLLQVCNSQQAGNRIYPCPLGSSELSGTGFETRAGTGWLRTQAPIDKPGEEITLLFTVWDSEDGKLDTTGLFDGIRFDAAQGKASTIPLPR